jgi:hypothetical protein
MKTKTRSWKEIEKKLFTRASALAGIDPPVLARSDPPHVR